MSNDEVVVETIEKCYDNMSSDGFENIREQKTKQTDLEQKTMDAKSKREKYKQSGTQKDFQDAVLTDLDVIKATLGI